MVFRFRMLSDENDNFVRDYEAMYDMTLLDFHDFILQSLEYEPCMASFFTADDRWEKQREFTSVEMDDGSGDAPAAMESCLLYTSRMLVKALGCSSGCAELVPK